MARYPRKSQRKVKKVMHEFKKGTLKSGRSGKKVKNPKQAVAIGLSEARREGIDVPPPKKNTKTKRSKKAKKKTGKKTKKTARRKSAAKGAKEKSVRRKGRRQAKSE